MIRKFRVWDKKRKKMIYPDEIPEVNPKECGRLIYTDIETIAIGMNGELYILDECGNYERAEDIDEDYEAMWWTRLRDINRREIYEKDMVKGQGDKVYFVEWMVNYGGFAFIRMNDDIPVAIPAYEFTNVWSEIIGNTYEHSHLLEGNNDNDDTNSSL